MKKVNSILSKIIYASHRRLKKIEVRCDSSKLPYLEALSSINAIEFYKDKYRKDIYTIIIPYYFGKPVLNNITRVGKRNTGGVTLSKWTRLQNSRKAIFIANTDSGIKLVDLVTSKNTPLSLIFKIELN